MSKSLNTEREILEKELKDFEKFGSSYSDYEDYLACKTKSDKIYDKKVESFRIRSKCDWYGKGEKYTIFLLALEKTHTTEINKHLYYFYQKFFSKTNDIFGVAISARQKPSEIA